MTVEFQSMGRPVLKSTARIRVTWPTPTGKAIASGCLPGASDAASWASAASLCLAEAAMARLEAWGGANHFDPRLYLRILELVVSGDLEAGVGAAERYSDSNQVEILEARARAYGIAARYAGQRAKEEKARLLWEAAEQLANAIGVRDTTNGCCYYSLIKARILSELADLAAQQADEHRAATYVQTASEDLTRIEGDLGARACSKRDVLSAIDNVGFAYLHLGQMHPALQFLSKHLAQCESKEVEQFWDYISPENGDLNANVFRPLVFKLVDEDGVDALARTIDALTFLGDAQRRELRVAAFTHLARRAISEGRAADAQIWMSNVYGLTGPHLDYADALVEYGRSAARAGRFDLAQDAVRGLDLVKEHLQSMAPYQSRIMNGVAAAYVAQGKFEAAIKAVQSLLPQDRRLDTEDVQNIVVPLILMGRYEDAFWFVFEAGAKDNTALAIVARAYSKVGQLSHARDTLAQCRTRVSSPADDLDRINEIVEISSALR